MKCLSCGEEISLIAKVCPHCHRDTKASNDAQGAMFGLAVIGAIIGYIINDLFGAFIGAIIVGGVGGGIAYIVYQSKYDREAASVKLVNDCIENAGAEKENKVGTHAERIEVLVDLKSRGLITDDEYNERRSKIINDL